MKVWTMVVVSLFAAWTVALVFSVSLGGAIHLLPALALLLVARRVMIRRDPSSTSYARWLASKGADR
jgi:ABC-type nickel/cobalt efflux system permease component RcnA